MPLLDSAKSLEDIWILQCDVDSCRHKHFFEFSRGDDPAPDCPRCGGGLLLIAWVQRGDIFLSDSRGIYVAHLISSIHSALSSRSLVHSVTGLQDLQQRRFQLLYINPRTRHAQPDAISSE